MRLFYGIAFLVVFAMTASPFLFLHGAETTGNIESVVTGYDENLQPIVNHSPAVCYDTYPDEVRSIDPSTCGDTLSSTFQAEIFDGLYTYDYLMRDEGRPIIVPQLAAGPVQISEDRLTYTIPLRQDVYFHRNPCFGMETETLPRTRKVVAADFVLAFKRVADSHNLNASSLSWPLITGRIVGLDQYYDTCKQYNKGDFSRYQLDVEGVQALDDHTLQLKLVKPYPQLEMVLAMSLYAPIPHEAVQYWLAGEGRLETPIPQDDRKVEFKHREEIVGTGAYLLARWERKHLIQLVRNPEFRQEYYPTAEQLLALAPNKEDGQAQIAELERLGLLNDAGKRLPFIDAFQFELVAEPFPAWSLFLNKQVDAGGIPRNAFSSVLTPGRELTDKWAKKKIYLQTYSQPSVYWLAFNMQDPILSASPALRRAICLAYDAQSEINVLRNGRGIAIDSIVPQEFKAYQSAGGGKYFRFDAEEAKAQIVVARQELAAAGLLSNGEIPTLELAIPQGHDNLGEFCELQFQHIGLDIKVEYFSWPIFLDRLHKKRLQVSSGSGWHADYYDAENFLQNFYGPNVDAGTNTSIWKNQEFDALFEQARNMPDSPERTALYAQALQIIYEECPCRPISSPESMVLFYEWYRNILPHPIGYGYRKFRRIDTELRASLGGRQ